ncbi:MAG: hypothetical protein O2968_04570 [Acidobacteria bacterium]|nr:hypothetical protein [Acidobacteriota bacterium]
MEPIPVQQRGAVPDGNYPGPITSAKLLQGDKAVRYDKQSCGAHVSMLDSVEDG